VRYIPHDLGQEQEVCRTTFILCKAATKHWITIWHKEVDNIHITIQIQLRNYMENIRTPSQLLRQHVNGCTNHASCSKVTTRLASLQWRLSLSTYAHMHCGQFMGGESFYLFIYLFIITHLLIFSTLRQTKTCKRRIKFIHKKMLQCRPLNLLF